MRARLYRITQGSGTFYVDYIEGDAPAIRVFATSDHVTAIRVRDEIQNAYDQGFWAGRGERYGTT